MKNRSSFKNQLFYLLPVFDERKQALFLRGLSFTIFPFYLFIKDQGKIVKEVPRGKRKKIPTLRSDALFITERIMVFTNELEDGWFLFLLDVFFT